MKNALLIVAVIAVGTFGVLYFINQGKTAASAPSVITQNEAVKTVEMEAGSFYYKPSVITARTGEKVRIVLHSVSMMHNFNIDELNIHSAMVKNGDTATFEFTAGKRGTYEYYCSVGKHRQFGQVGTLTVQ